MYYYYHLYRVWKRGQRLRRRKQTDSDNETGNLANKKLLFNRGMA